MGMPPCRIGDTTAHGGAIVLGFPTVLIGMLPASRIGDMHVCPMITPGLPPIPHVGGPFILGSPTVLVGMMPQSRVTDTLVCVGPPDVAMLGEMTVLVGMAGAGGAAGASSGAAAMGAPVAPVGKAAAETAAKQPKAEAQADGTIKTSAAAPGTALPPVALQQPTWPTLPPEATATFSSVQPATIQPGTTLYAVTDGASDGSNSFFQIAPPLPPEIPAADSLLADPDAAPDLSDWNAATHVQVSTVPPGPGLKGWAGKPAAGAGNPEELHIWVPGGSLKGAPSQRFRMPGGTR